jgi:hypothetical protein
MGRVINTDSPSKIRNRHMRTGAELMRHLSQKQAFDAEARDMAALLFYCLREIEDGIEDSAAVWEKRDYWIKAEQLRQRWGWVSQGADRLEHAMRTEAWEKMPEIMAQLFPNFADIKITRFTREADLWQGCYDRFVSSAS